MQSEASDLRSPTAGEQRGWDVLGAARTRLRLQVGPRADQSNTWFRLPTSTSQHLPGLRIICAVDAQFEDVMRNGEQCRPDLLRVCP